MNNKHAIQGIELEEHTWRALYNFMMRGGSRTVFIPELEPDFKVAYRSMEFAGLLLVSKDEEDRNFVTWTATETPNAVWKNAEDEIRALLEL